MKSPSSAQGLQFAAAQTLYLAVFGAASWFWLRWTGVDTTATVTAVCCLPVALEAALAATSQADYRQYLARLGACALFAPILLLFWSTSLDPAPAWPFPVAAAATHALVFVAGLFWIGTRATRVAAEPNATAVAAGTLVARLVSLANPGTPFTVERAPAGEVVARFLYPADAGRSHVVYLRLDSARGEVHVRERLSARDAKPRNEAEASLRRPGDKLLDPSRPTAARVSGVVAQTTLIEPARLQATPLTTSGSTAELPVDFASRLDEEGLVTALCLLVIRSGWHWQPEFFARGD